jgi:5-methyltetrahydrofolate--homocysteine methyltransferase
VPFDPASYRNEIILAGSEFRTTLCGLGMDAAPPATGLSPQQVETIRAVADAYLTAGARGLVTFTDDANAIAMAEAIEAGETAVEVLATVNREAAASCRVAIESHGAAGCWVLGAIGPVEPLLTLGEIDPAALSDAYRTQAAALAQGGVDGILCRSFVEIEALVVAVTAAREASGLPVVASMTFDCGPESSETTMGVTVPQACQSLVEAGAAMVGCDRGRQPDGVSALVSLMRESCGLPIWVEVNAGLPELDDQRLVYPETPNAFGERFTSLAEAGASIIGGGHGVTPAHIAELARVRERWVKRSKRRG